MVHQKVIPFSVILILTLRSGLRFNSCRQFIRNNGDGCHYSCAFYVQYLLVFVYLAALLPCLLWARCSTADTAVQLLLSRKLLG